MRKPLMSSLMPLSNPGAGTYVRLQQPVLWPTIQRHLLQRARYAAKVGKVIDEITRAELSSGRELPIISDLLAKPSDTSADIGRPCRSPIRRNRPPRCRLRSA